MGVQDRGASRGGFWWILSSWPTDGHFSPCPQGPSLCVCTLLTLCLLPWGHQSSEMRAPPLTSFNLQYLVKAPSPNAVTLGVKIWGRQFSSWRTIKGNLENTSSYVSGLFKKSSICNFSEVHKKVFSWFPFLSLDLKYGDIIIIFLSQHLPKATLPLITPDYKLSSVSSRLWLHQSQHFLPLHCSPWDFSSLQPINRTASPILTHNTNLCDQLASSNELLFLSLSAIFHGVLNLCPSGILVLFFFHSYYSSLLKAITNLLIRIQWSPSSPKLSHLPEIHDPADQLLWA